MSKSYILRHRDSGTQVLLHYNQRGWLLQFTAEDNINKDLHLLVLQNIALTIVNAREFIAANPTWRLDEALTDLSFESFWKQYNYKVGKKQRCERLWHSMSDTDKAACLNSVRRYHAWLASNTVAQCYPETYLAQRRYDNEL